MKKLFFFSLLAVAAFIPAKGADDNLLKNGDFSNGITEWEGDGHTPGSTTFDSPDTPVPTSGIVVKLHHGAWTKVSQEFYGKAGKFLLTVTYEGSPDLKFSTRNDDYANVPGQLEVTPSLVPFDGNLGQWNLIVIDVGAGRYRYWAITPKSNATGVQTVTTHLKFNSDDSVKKSFYLVFPPGEGFINLKSISLVAAPSEVQP